VAESRILVIRGGLVVDVTRSAAELGHVVIAHGQIREVVRGAPPAIEGAEIVAAEGCAIMPGLVNAHTHSQGNLAKAAEDRINLEQLLNAGSWFNSHRTLEDMHLSALIGAAEMVRRGCTACYDLSTELPMPSLDGMMAIASAYADIGMRAVLAPQLSDRTLYDVVPGLEDIPRNVPAALPAQATRPPTPEILAGMRRLARDWRHGAHNIELGIAPTIPLLCSDELLAGCREIADEFGLKVHSHLAESRVWAARGRQVYGESLVERLDRLGFLSPRFTGAHAVWISDDDMRRMADRGAHVAHNPASNMRLGSGLAKIRRMLRAGMNVGLGTDAANCGDHLNMFEALRLSAYVSRVQDEPYSEWISAGESLRMATEGSARLIGLERRIGAVAPGYDADLVFLDLRDVSVVPLTNLVNQIVLCADSSIVDSVMIRGRFVLRHRAFTTLDYERLRHRAQESWERLNGAQAARRAYFSDAQALIAERCRAVSEAAEP
jgi:5-methylthioadenosine/S-adenosylhomocysteine deaminase